MHRSNRHRVNPLTRVEELVFPQHPVSLKSTAQDDPVELSIVRDLPDVRVGKRAVELVDQRVVATIHVER